MLLLKIPIDGKLMVKRKVIRIFTVTAKFVEKMAIKEKTADLFGFVISVEVNFTSLTLVTKIPIERM
jgi:hypothetical protein